MKDKKKRKDKNGKGGDKAGRREKNRDKKSDKKKDKSKFKKDTAAIDEWSEASQPVSQDPVVTTVEPSDDRAVSQPEPPAPVAAGAESPPSGEPAATPTPPTASRKATGGAKPHYHVFLSHNSQDKSAVEPLAVMLREKGLNPFLDKWNLVPGEPIEDALIKALENSDSAVIFVGPGGEGPWQSEEMRDILKRAVKSQNEFRAIPVLLPGASAEALEKSFMGSRLWIEFKDIDDADSLLRMAKAIQGEASGDPSFTLPDEPAPYRGLERFERIENPEEDFFFGRDDEIRALVERLVKERFVAVVGASGSGKSSLIRAGLTKQLAEEIHPGILRWQTITVEPGSAPFRSLAVQVAVAAGVPVAEREDWIEKTVAKWRAAPDGVRTSIETLFADAKDPLLVFIDQFEELFTHRKEGEEAERIARNFVANLEDIWRNGGDRVRVVVALRADFVERCLEIGPLKELLQDRTMLVGEVGDDALREIVKEPAARVGAFLEKGLMERILSEVRNQSGSLPLLQQALHGLWRNRKGAWLTHAALDASGGVARALNDQAQGAYKSLNDTQKQIADNLFPRLITLGDGVSDTRRRVVRNELYPQGVEPAAVNEVIDHLSGKDARILVTTREGGSEEDIGAGEDFVEFTHEALLGNWQHLVTLLDSERESIRKHRTLTSAAEDWESKPELERRKFLLREGQLVIAEQWAKDEGGYARLNQTERLFLDQSIQERTAEEARKAKIARRLKMLSIAASAAALVAFAVGGYAFVQQRRAVEAKDEAENLVIEGYFKAFGNSKTLTGQEVESLWDIASIVDSSWRVKCVEHMLSTDKVATQVLGKINTYANEMPRLRLDYVAHALVGLSRENREALLDQAMTSLKATPAASDAKKAAAKLCAHFVGEQRVVEVATVLAAAMRDERDSATLSSLGETLGSLGEQLPAESAADGATALVAAMRVAKDAKDVAALSSLGKALGSLVGQLPAESAPAVATVLAAAMQEEMDGDTLSSLGRALGSLGGQLPTESAVAGAKRLVRAMKDESSTGLLHRWLRDALRSLGEQLPAESADDVAKALVQAMQETDSVDALDFLGDALGSLCQRLSAESVVDLATALMEAMQVPKGVKGVKGENFDSLGRALGILGVRLPAESAAAFATALVKAMKDPKNVYALSTLGEALGSLGGRLPAASAADGATALVEAMKKPNNVDARPSLGKALGSLGQRLPAESAADAATALVAAMQHPKDWEDFAALGEALGSLGQRLPAESAPAFATALVKAMKDPKNVYALSSLGEALGSLGDQLPAESAVDGATALVEAMQVPKEVKDVDDLSSLGKALGSLGQQLPAESAADGATALVEAIEDPKNVDALSSLGEALGSLGDQLPAESAVAGAGATALVKAMRGAKVRKDFNALSTLGEALGSLGEQLPAESAADGATALVEAMQDAKDAKNVDALSSLSKALGSLGEQLPAESAAAGATALVKAMLDQQNGDTLSSLGKALGSLGQQLPAESAADGATALVEAIEDPKNVDALSSLGEALGSLGDQLPAESAVAGAGATALVKAMRGAKVRKDFNALSTLGEALGSLGEQLPAESAAAGATALVKAMLDQQNGDTLSSLGKALGSLGERLSAESAAAIATALVEAMQDPQSSHVLSSLGRALGCLVERLPAESAIELLKSPLCIGRARSCVLKALEKATTRVFHDEFALHLITTETTSSILGAGKRLAIIAEVEDQLDFRIFDASGKMVMDQSNQDFFREAQAYIDPTEFHTKLNSLKKQLQVLWDRKDISLTKQKEIIEAVANLLDDPIYHYDIWKLIDQADELGLEDVEIPPKRVRNRGSEK